VSPSTSLRVVALALATSCVFFEDSRSGLGEDCLFNGDCASPNVCAGRRCRAPCRDDRDCANGWRCRSSGQGPQRVCLPPEELGYCALSGKCPQPFVCDAEGQCVAQCREAADCRRYHPTGSLRCVPVSLPEGGRANVCENHPWLRDGGVALDAFGDVPAVDARSDVRVDGAPLADVARDAADASSPLCPTAVDGACTPGDACPVAGVALGTGGGCAWFADGSVRCWHVSSNSNLLHNTDPRAYCPRPAVRFPASDLRELSINGHQGCLRTAGGLARCWGAGLLGDGSIGSAASATPVTVERYPDDGPLTGVTTLMLATGRGACVVAGPARRVYCWGPNGVPLSGDGSEAARTRAVENPVLDEVDALAIGGGYGCALRRAAVWCFGATSASTGADDAGAPPTRLVTTPLPVVQVAAGVHHTCAVLMDRTVACFGSILQASGGTVEQATPTVVAGLTDVVEVVGMWMSTCARRTDGSVWCWGEGWARGDGSMTDRATPAPVPGLAGVQRLWGRDRTVCAWRGGAELWCWGEAFGDEGPWALTPTRVRWSEP
jgi:hypothetical protein